MGYGGTPPQEWNSSDVGHWLGTIGLGHLASSFATNGVVGSDLGTLTAEDLCGSLGATPFQAKKIQAELVKLGVQATTGYPAAPAPTVTPRGDYGPPAGYPPPQSAYPPPYAMPPPMQPQYVAPPQYAAPVAPYAAPTSPLAQHSSAGMSLAGSKEMEDLKAELAREKLKNDLRLEMDTSSRLAAMEAAARHAPAAAPVVVSNNNNLSNSAAVGNIGGGGGYYKPAPPRPPAPFKRQVVGHESYCGCCSFMLFFIFPCIVCCPVDERPIYSQPPKVVQTITTTYKR